MKYLHQEIFTGVGIEVEVSTTGYDCGDNSVTRLQLKPFAGFQSSAGAAAPEGAYTVDDPWVVSFTAKGDLELNALRRVLQISAEMLDELLAE